uniref:Titin n=1 Tax=Pundamilia nyererei TaxID=303518 RepID=A0A3B4H730_9CICH
MIVIKDSIRVDGGTYTLQLKNEAGSETVPFKVLVLDKPSPCEGPLHVTGVAEDRCTLVWHPPLHDGGSPITHYIIERRETSRLAWTVVSSNCGITCYKVTKLLEGDEYMFRVMAVNSHGVSEPLESGAVIMKTPFVLPGPPHIEDVSNIAHDGMTISWSAPETDGGSEITNYIIEKKDRTGIKWTRCNRQKVTDLSFRVTGLTTGHEYEFRVAAENIVGVGEPSLASSYYKACDPKYKPGAPGYVHVIDSTKTSITVSWGKPLSDGGSVIQGYIVEVCKAEEEEWTMVTPPTGLRVNKYEITKLTEGQEYKIQVCALNKLGVGEPAVLSGTAKPEERVEPPEIHLDSELRKGIVLKAGGSVRINIPFKGRPTPEIKWTKDDGNLTEKPVVEKAHNFTQLSIDSCDRSDSGKYTLTLTNSSGTVSEVISVKILDAPGAPQNLVVKEIRKDSVTLAWDAPLIDGGAKIKNYVIDKRESTRKAYANVSTKCTKTTFKVENLIEGAMYYFRVMAENEYGIGPAVETKTASKASEVPLPVGKIFLNDVTKSSVSLAWEKPEQDGGSRIAGYLIEMQPKGTDKWGVATNTKTCEGTVTGLTAGTEYLFRIIAYNEKGKSEPKALAAPVIATDMTMEPSIKIPFNTYSVLAGKDLKLDFPVLGKPKPKVTWAKDGQPLKVTSRMNIISTKTTTGIEITEACKEDFGKYTITAANTTGTTAEDVSVIILDKPGPPKGPVKIVEVSNTFVHLSWDPPEYTGGCQVKNYIVEKRDTTSTTWLSWTVAASDIKGLYHKVTNLLPGDEYIFRVRAVNKFGIGDYLESEPIIARNPYKPPSAPGTPEASLITKDSIVLSWTAPEQTGGAEIEGYHLEKRDKDSVRWTKCNRQKLTDAQFKVTGLSTDHFYEFRVAAENEVGMGDFSELSLFYRACDAIRPPGPPHHPKVTDYTKSSVSLSWGKPDFDGGAYIKGYIVEMREYTPVPDGIQATKLTITDLKEGGEYQFRVYAINSEGVGEAANVHGTVVTSDRAEAPEIELDAELRKVLSVRAGGTLRLFVTIRGRPEPAVKWEKVDSTLTERAVIDTTSSFTMLVIDNVNRFDSGKYSLTLENSSGKKSAIVAPKIVNSTKDTVSIEVLESPEELARWVEAIPLTKSLEFTITGLKTDAEYEFCVKAINKVGSSVRSPYSNPSAAKDRTAEPSFDVDIEMRKVLSVKHGTAFTLNVPFKGNPLPSVTWAKEGVDLKVRGTIESTESSTSLTIEKSTRNDSGEYTVTIESPLGKATLPVVVKVLDSPGPPVNVKVSSVTRDSATLTWDPPENDGGDAVKAYHVEKREASKKAWVSVTGNCHTLTYKVEDLQEGAIYYFRVIGENEYGVGVPQDAKAGTKITGNICTECLYL